MIIGIIPARGGSKGIPRKNIKPIAGFPLIYWTIQAAKQSKLLDDFFVSTEDDEIANIAKQYGAKVLKRPVELARDYTSTNDVLRYIVEEKECLAIVVLQPTSPLRNHALIDECIADYLRGNYNTLATGYYTKIIEYATHKNLRRQDIEGFFYDDGNVYIIDADVIKRGDWYGGKICKKLVDKELRFEIDDEVDFEIAEFLLRKRLRQNRQPSDFISKLANVKLFIMDVDGVLTDGGMYYSENGDELKKFNTRDGHGINLLRDKGIKIAVITTEQTEIVSNRAKKLKIDYLFQGALNKAQYLDGLLSKENISIENVLFVGDDLNDLEIMKNVGVPVAVKNACDEIKNIAIYTTQKKGGEGAIREICDLLINQDYTREV